MTYANPAAIPGNQNEVRYIDSIGLFRVKNAGAGAASQIPWPACRTKPPVNLSAMNRAFFEGLNSGARLELLCRLHAMTVELAERLAKNSTNSSKPPSSDSPFGGLPSKGEGGQK